MNATAEPLSLQAEIVEKLREFPALRRVYRKGRAARAEALAIALRDPPAPEPPPDPGRDLAGLEERTEDFRAQLARKHVARLREVNGAARLALEEWTDVVAGEAPELPCKNTRWRPGARRPPAQVRRCTEVTTIAGHNFRCAFLAGHLGHHEIDRTRAPARALVRECDREPGWCLRLRGHKGKCKARRPSAYFKTCPCALCTLHQAETSREWHEGRELGQRFRFEHVRLCGSRMRTASCGVCGTDSRAVPEGCGVRRVCDKCDTQGAIARRARFGRARGRAFVDGTRYGLTRKLRVGGRYTEKMLTLTIPHRSLEQASGIVRKEARDTLHARVIALGAAWPRFLRKVNRHWKDRGETHVTYHRAFEWTPGKDDEHGHPHFHVYLWCPFVDADLLRAWWAESLREVGWPVAVYKDSGRPKIQVDLRMLRSMNIAAVRELMKGGKRQALTLSRIDFQKPHEGAIFRRGAPRAGQAVGPGIDAFKYAEGWTLGDVADCSDDVRARLYMALEARRLTQASRGFFLDDLRASCECCGASMFRVRFEAAAPVIVLAPLARAVLHATGPP